MARKKTTVSESEHKDINFSINLKTITVPIVGITPLIMHKFSTKSVQQLKEIGEIESGMKQGGKKKNIANPEVDYLNSIYYFADGKRCGMPAIALKSAMV